MGNLVGPRVENAAGTLHVGVSVWLLLSLIAGIVAAWLGAGQAVALTCIAGAFAFYFLLLLLGKTPAAAIRTGKLHYIWVVMLFAGIGMETWLLHQHDIPRYLPPDGTAVRARVTDVRETSERQTITVKLLGLRAKGNVNTDTCVGLKAMLHTDVAPLQRGDIIEFHSQFRALSDSSATLPAGYIERLTRRGVYMRQNILADDIRYIDHEFTMAGLADSWRDRLEIAVDKSGVSGQTANFIAAILLGDRYTMPEERRQTFADAGVAHTLAVSGMHTGIIASIFLFLLLPLNAFNRQKLRYLLVIPLIWLFTFLTGMALATVRAAIMLTFCFIAIALERKASLIDALLWSAIVILLIWPEALWDAGLQLSFVCVFALIVFADRLNTVDHRAHPRTYKFNAMLLASLVATIASWPLLACHFSEVSLIFIPVNILVLPLLPLFMTCSLFAIGIALASGTLPGWLTWILDHAVSSLYSLTSWMAGDGEYVWHTTITWPSVIIWIGFLISLALLIHSKWNRKITLAVSAACLLMFAGSVSLFAEDGEVADGQPQLTVPRSFPEIRLLSRSEDGHITVHRFQRYHISTLHTAGTDILAVDAMTSDSIPLPASDIVIVGGGYEGSLEMLRKRTGGNPLFILHSTLRRPRSARLQQEADSLGLRAHSITTAGDWSSQK